MKRLFLFLFVFVSGYLYGQDYSAICISQEEKELLKFINDYRVENGLLALEISAALSYTADMHTSDLYFNKPHIKGKSLYSWSNKGKWKKLNYKRAKNPIKDIKDKPSELTRYNGQSLEAVFYSSGVFSPRLVFERWKQNEDINKLMLNRGSFATSVWQVIGISHFEGYTSVWFGPLEDNTGKVVFCEGEPALLLVQEEHRKDETAKIKYSELYNTDKEEIKTESLKQEEITEPTPEPVAVHKHNQYHVIIASASDMNSAKRMINIYKEKGLSNANIISKDGKYRISVSSFNTRIEADQFKQKIINKYGYKDAWILKD